MTQNNSHKKIRINKWLADAGLASRRGADTLVAQQAVLVNGAIATIGQMIDPTKDVVGIKHDNASNLPKTYSLYFKKRGETVDEALFAIRQKNAFRDVSFVGRLDKDVSGILLATNDGRLARAFAERGKDVEKEYRIRVDKPITHKFLSDVKRGVTLHRITGTFPRIKKTTYTTAPLLIKKIESDQCDVILFDEKNENLREICASFGYKLRLIERFRIGTLSGEHLRPKSLTPIAQKDLVHLFAWAGIAGE